MKRSKKSNFRAKYERFRKSRAAYWLYDKGILYFALSFLIPSSIMLFAFAQHSIHPFGDKQMLFHGRSEEEAPFQLMAHGRNDPAEQQEDARRRKAAEGIQAP